MADNIIDFDGFEKYGPVPNGATWGSLSNPNFVGVNASSTLLPAQSFLREWQTWGWSGNSRNASIITGLAGSGAALLLTGASTGAVFARRTMPNSYTRFIFGFAFMSNLGTNTGVNFWDAITSQCCVYVDSSGRINFARGFLNGGATVLYTSAALIVSGVRHYLEVDVTINNATGAFKIWLDGNLLTNTTGVNNRVSSNNFVNGFDLACGNNDGASMAYDDMYWRDNTGGTATPFGDVSIIGRKVTADSAVQFTPTAVPVGPYYIQQTSVNQTDAPGVDLALVPVTPETNCTLQSVGILPASSSITAKFRGVVYSDASGAPSLLLSSGTEVVGCSATTPLTLPLVTPVSLTAGIQYWVGYITDTSLALWRSNTFEATGQKKANTYASGPPAGPLSGMTTGQNPWCIWGTGNAAPTNFQSADNTPPVVGSLPVMIGYNESSTVGNQDLFEVLDLPSPAPSVIYSVKVSVMAQKSAPGPRTMDVRVKSGTTESSGTASGFSPSTTPQWYATRYDVDPDTGAAWTPAAINAMKAGYKLVS